MFQNLDSRKYTGNLRQVPFLSDSIYVYRLLTILSLSAAECPAIFLFLLELQIKLFIYRPGESP